MLIAELAEAPSRWAHLVHLPFGPEKEELGALWFDPVHEITEDWVPASFTVAGDGSFWVLDFVKERLAHYSPTGKYLGSLGHFPIAGRWMARDVLWWDGRLYVLVVHTWTTEASIAILGRGSRRQDVPLRLVGEPAGLSRLVPGAAALTGDAVRCAETEGHPYPGQPMGWADLEALESGGAVDVLPGVPLSDGVSMGLRMVPWVSNGLEATFESEEVSTVLPILIRLVPKPGAAPLRTSVGASVDGALAHGLVA